MKRNTAKQNRTWLLLMAGGVLLLVAGYILSMGAGQNANSSTSGQNTSSDLADVPRITLQESINAYNDNSAVFLDVRTEQEYEQSHIPGALFIPFNELGSRLGELDPGTAYITYCT